MEERAIHYAVSPCPLGWLLVAATRRGVCRVALGDDAASLEALVREEFSFAELRAGADWLEPWVEALRAGAAGCCPPRGVPLDVRGSQFQRRVWSAICRIPRGETRSYGILARALGRPGAARAVARACAANPVALAIPCHRVVRSDGGSGGYRLGVDRKRRLLSREADASEPDAPEAGDRTRPGVPWPGSEAEEEAWASRRTRRSLAT
jgi:AraC family transcriptional regulator of adaptative response/methylated-DNA-[protein]-cysteine methyltransferase